MEKPYSKHCMTTKQLMDALDIKSTTFYEMKKKHTIPSYMVNGSARYDLYDVIEYFKKEGVIYDVK
jgi:predicted DNA-binding transcriptional regulator AlpA